MTIKNNVTRFLDSKKIKYKLHISQAEKRTAIETAGILGADPKVVFKTIVTLRPKGGKAILALIPGSASLDLKSLAKIFGEKKLVLSTHTEAEKLTGMQTGGISPLALINKGFQVVMDSSGLDYPDIYISGGQRGMTIQIKASDLKNLVNAKISSISKID